MFAKSLIFASMILAAAVVSAAPASAQVSDDVVKIGVLTDMNGPASAATGRGSLIAAQMAIERGFSWLILGSVSCQIPLAPRQASSCALLS